LATAVIEHFNRLGREGQVDIPGFAKWLKDHQYSEDDINAGEMIAHIADEFAFDQQFWDAAFANNPTLGARALAAVLKWIDKIAILLKLKEPTITADVHGQFLKTAEAVDTMREQLAKAYAGMAARARAGGSASKGESTQGSPSRIPLSLDINPNKAVGMAAAKVPVVAEAPPVALTNNVAEAARAMRILMESSSAKVRARGGMMVNLASPDRARAEMLKTDPITARLAHALNSGTSRYLQPDPAKVRAAPLTRHTLINADMMVNARTMRDAYHPHGSKSTKTAAAPQASYGTLWLRTRMVNSKRSIPHPQSPAPLLKRPS
jgi:hypothetical protein